MINKIIEIANNVQAASRGEYYALSNILFGVLLNKVFSGEPRLCLELETNETTGDPHETYYDLFVITFESDSLCIPAPLLETSAAIAAMKRATIVPRRETSRSDHPDVDFTMSDLWREVYELLDEETLFDGRRNLKEQPAIPYFEKVG